MDCQTSGEWGPERVEKDDFSERLKNLENRIKVAQPAARPGGAAHGKYTQSSLAWRMVTELVAGMFLGLAIGYGLDALFGTAPFLLVVFALLGFAAGVRTMLRTAAEMNAGRGEAALMHRAAAERAAPDQDETRRGPGES
jgi:ATP synthase protein I